MKLTQQTQDKNFISYTSTTHELLSTDKEKGGKKQTEISRDILPMGSEKTLP